MSFRKLIIGMLFTVIPISVAGLYAISQSDRALESVIGAYFSTIAQSASSEISLLVHQSVEQAALIATDAAVLDAVNQASRSYVGMSDAAIAEKAKRIGKEWNAPGGRAASEMLASRASQQLRRFRQMNPRFLRITVTDEKGAAIAATHKTLDYWQADEEFWQNIQAGGGGAVSLTDILYDEVTKANYIGVGVPILDQPTGKFIGVVDALMDLSSIFAVINRVQLGRTGRAMLVKEDGTIIGAPEISLAMQQKSIEYAALQDAVKNLGARRAGFVLSTLAAGRHIIGYSDTGLKRDYRALGSVALVVQESTEAFAAVRVVNRLLALMALIGLALITLLAVYFSIHRAIKYTDIEEVREEPSSKAASA